MKLDIDGIQAFVMIADLGGFQKAAEKLGLTQTALTRRIQRLEGYLGVRLLDRTTRSVALTKVGREFLPQANRLVEELTRSFDRLKGLSDSTAGDVRIACITSMAYQRLPGIVRVYAEKYPGNRVSILDRTGTQVAEAVRQGHAEFGVTVLPTREADLVEEPILKSVHALLLAHAVHERARAQHGLICAAWTSSLSARAAGTGFWSTISSRANGWTSGGASRSSRCRLRSVSCPLASVSPFSRLPRCWQKRIPRCGRSRCSTR